MERISFLGEVPGVVRNQKEDYASWLTDIVYERGFSVSRLSYTFLSNEKIRALNRKLLAHDYATDIITINHSRSRKLKVELYLGSQVIVGNAKDLGLSLDIEFARVMVHGILHCMGWDDQSDDDKLRMRREEEICLISRPVIDVK